MRRTKGRLGQRTKLSLVVGNTLYLDSFIGGVVSATSFEPSASAAVALKEEAVDVASGSDWPQRPDGVGDRDLLNEWLRLRTPKASISGRKRKDGTVKRTPHSYSNIAKPRGTALNDAGMMRQDVYATPLKERIARLQNSHASRYRSGAARGIVQEMVNTKALRYAQACHKHTVDVWEPIVLGLKAKAIKDAEAYDFDERMTMRKMELYEDRRDIDVTGMDWHEAANDASVAAVIGHFVGPIKPIGTVVPSVKQDVESPEMLMAKLEAKRYNRRRRELEQAEDMRSVYEKKRAIRAETLTPYEAMVLQGNLKQQVENFYWNRKKIHMFKARCAPEITRAKRKVLALWNEQQGENHRAVYDRSIARQYLLRNLRKSHRPQTLSKYQPISRKTFALFSGAGNWLPSSEETRNTYFKSDPVADSLMLRARFHYYKKRKKELAETFSKLLGTTPVVSAVAKTPVGQGKMFTSDEILTSLYHRIVSDWEKAKAAIKVEVSAARQKILGTEWVATQEGVLIPADTGLVLEPGW